MNAMAARDYFNPSPDPQNPFTRNQFGASFGGPIVKDKTFFFVNSEWDRFRTTLTNSAVVPTAAFKTGIFTYNGQQINLANPASPNNALGLPLDPDDAEGLRALSQSERAGGRRHPRHLLFPDRHAAKLQRHVPFASIIALTINTASLPAISTTAARLATP